MTNPDTEEKLRKLASLDPGAAETAWSLYVAGEGEERELASDLLDIILFKTAKKDFSESILLDPPPKERCAGEYELGTVLYPRDQPYCPFGLREEEWTQHLLITGMTGMGKTNLSYVILKELQRKKKPFMLFDWKLSARELAQLPEFENNLRVFTVGRNVRPFRFNPLLAPPGVPRGEWIGKITQVLSHAYLGGFGVEHLCRKAITQVYEKTGYLDGTDEKMPTFTQVREFVHRTPSMGREKLWKASTMRALDSLCFEYGLGPVVNAWKQWDYETLLSTNVVFELDALLNDDRVFLTEAMILWLYEFRKHNATRDKFLHALILEEAHHILSRKKESSEGQETIIETCLRMVRELGEAVIVLDQEPSKLSDSFIANSACKITFWLGNGKDKQEMANCLSLTKEETDYLDWLKKGEAMIVSERVRMPLHVKFPLVRLQKGRVTDADLPR